MASFTFLADISLAVENNTGWTSSNVVAPANSLLIVGSSANTEGGGSTQSVSASGLTFVEVDHYLNDNQVDVYLWYAVVGGGGFSGTVSVTPSSFQYGFTGIVGYFDTPDTSSPLVQSTKAALSATDTPGTPWAPSNNFTNPTVTGNMTFAYWAYGFSATGGAVTTPRSGWTEADSIIVNQNGYGASEMQSYFTSDTAASISYTSSGQGDVRKAKVIQAEFLTASGGGGTPAPALVPQIISF